MNDGAPAARYVLTADQLRQLEAAWGGRLPDSFHFVWSDEVPPTERDRRDSAAREALQATGLLGPGPDGPVERHVRRFLDVLHRPAVVVATQAWTQERQWIELVWCDAQWGASLLRTRRPSPDPAPSGPAAPWADEDAVHLTLAQRGTVLARPLDRLEQVRQPDDERTVVAGPVVLNLAESVAVVAACRPDRNPDVAHELLRQVGADQSGEPFRSLAAGIDAGFEVTVAAPGVLARHGLYLRSQGLWVSLGARIDSVLAQVAAGKEPPSGPVLADTATVRLVPVAASRIIADYLTTVTTVTTLQEGADQ